MSYRTRAERRYRRKQAKAAGKVPGTLGGWGKGMPVSRSDLLLVRKAIRERWPTPATTRAQIVARISQLHDEASKAEDVRLMLSIFGLIVDMEGDNQRRLFEALDAIEALDGK